MESITDIVVRRSGQSRVREVNFEKLEFGKYVSDHMLICDYISGEWESPQIVPFANLSMSPATLALHYGQTVFEGMKAFRMNDGTINIFRIDRHYERFGRSLERLCMAVPPKEIFTDGLIELVRTDKAWVPGEKGSSLYLRPFMYASESRFGIKVSDNFRFIIFSGPVPELYARPIKVKVETEYIRAAKGGTGFAKCGGNYGGAFYPTKLARQEGYDQVLWTNGQPDPLIEESGMMNIMFVINNMLVTPPLSDSILDGITRESLLALAIVMGIEVEERPISVSELESRFRHSEITEAFGVGTAAVVAPIQTIHIKGVDYHLPPYSHESVQNRIKHKLEGIRTGSEKDIFGWNNIV
jgi:branched-chain amino acid aminotransferase